VKKVIKLLLCCNFFLNSFAYAEVVTDGTVGAIQHLSGQMTIPQNLGTTAGNNLFHSFQSFNINMGESATFTGSHSIQNVISRVTGGQLSNIDGLLKSEVGNANFYFINPAGITFGTNAQVDVPAAFYLSTAESLRFSNGETFNNSSSLPSSLSISNPADFGFLSNSAGNIKIEGTSLSFQHENAVLFSADNLVINQSKLSNPSGKISLNAQKNLFLTNASDVNVSTQSTHDGGAIVVTASNMTVDNSYIRSNTNSSSDAGTISINSEKLLVQNSGQIGSSTYASGNAGIITIQSKELDIIGNPAGRTTAILTNAELGSSGKAGVISITSDAIILDKLGLIDSNTSGTGNAGSVNVTSNAEIVIANDGHISSSTKGAGNGGEVNVIANKLLIDEGHIHSVSFDGSSGDAGKTTLQAKELVISHGGIIHADAKPKSQGNAGSVVVNVDKLVLETGGAISSSAYALGAAGDVIVHAKTIDISGEGISSITHKPVYSQISAAATNTSKGQTGSVKVTADHSIYLHDGGMMSIQNDGIINNAIQNQTHSALNVFAPTITLDSSGIITAKSTGNADAGQIAVSFSQALLMDGNQSAITTQANSGNGGNLTINGNQLITLQNNAHIDTFTTTGKRGGDITINADRLMMNSGKIIAQADNANNGGDIFLTLNALIPSYNQLQVDLKPLTNSEMGINVFNIIQAARSGGVTLNVPQFNISGSISTLTQSFIELPDLNRDDCNLEVFKSFLMRSGNGGIPNNEAKTGFIPAAAVLPNSKPSSSKNSLASQQQAAYTASQKNNNYSCAALSSN
jgi:filamentous hemagglutinin family protein